MQKDTEYKKMEKWFSELEMILHPNFLSAFKIQLNKCYEENKKQAYEDAKISEEALWIDEKLKDVRKSILQHNNKQAEAFLYKCFYKDLLEKIKK